MDKANSGAVSAERPHPGMESPELRRRLVYAAELLLVTSWCILPDILARTLPTPSIAKPAVDSFQVAATYQVEWLAKSIGQTILVFVLTLRTGDFKYLGLRWKSRADLPIAVLLVALALGVQYWQAPLIFVEIDRWLSDPNSHVAWTAPALTTLLLRFVQGAGMILVLRAYLILRATQIFRVRWLAVTVSLIATGIFYPGYSDICWMAYLLSGLVGTLLFLKTNRLGPLIILNIVATGTVLVATYIYTH
jgi:hypothetical protein